MVRYVATERFTRKDARKEGKEEQDEDDDNKEDDDLVRGPCLDSIAKTLQYRRWSV